MASSTPPRALRRRLTATEDLDEEFLRSSNSLRGGSSPTAASRTSSAIFEEAFMETVFAEPVPASKDPEPRSLRRMASFMLDETLNEVLQNEEGKGTNAAVEEETAVELVQFSHGLIRRVGLKAGNENLVAVDASERHAVAVSSAGKIYGWGDNGDFQLALDVDNENELKDAYEVGLFASLTFGTLCQRKGVLKHGTRRP